jgi:hypothetical protein
MKINTIYWQQFSFFLSQILLIWYFPKAICELKREKWKKNSHQPNQHSQLINSFNLLNLINLINPIYHLTIRPTPALLPQPP